MSHISIRRQRKRVFDVLSCLGAAIGLLSLFYTINGDIIIQHDNAFLYPLHALEDTSPPGIRLKKAENGKNDNNKKEMTYVLVLDVSASISKTKDKPWWIKSVLKQVNLQIKDLEKRFPTNRDLSEFEVSKIKLAKLLYDLGSGINGQARFAVWLLGDESRNIYPKNEKSFFAKVNVENINEAIVEVAMQPNTSKRGKLQNIGQDYKGDLNTDFNDLFDNIYAHYRVGNGGHTVDSASSQVTLILLSDLVHDVKEKLEKDNTGSALESFNSDKNDLVLNISKLASSNLLANVVLLSKSRKEQGALGEHQTDLLKLMNNSFPKHRFSRMHVSDVGSEILYVPVEYPEDIRFNYLNPHSIISACDIHIANPGNYKMGLAYNSYSDNGAYNDFSLRFDVYHRGGQSAGQSGVLVAGRNTYPVKDLREGDYIRLTYSGHIPRNSILPSLKVYSPEKFQEISIFEIDFIKDLHSNSALIMVILMALILLIIVALIIVIICYIIGLRRVGNAEGKPGNHSSDDHKESHKSDSKEKSINSGHDYSPKDVQCLESEAKEQLSRANTLAGECDKVKNDLAEIKSEKDTVSVECERFRILYDNEKGRTADFSQKTLKLEMQCSVLDEKLTNVGKDLGDCQGELDSKIVTIERMLAENKIEGENYNSNNVELRKTLDKMKKSNEKLEERAIELCSVNQELIVERTNLRRNGTRLKNLNDKLKEEIVALGDQ